MVYVKKPNSYFGCGSGSNSCKPEFSQLYPEIVYFLHQAYSQAVYGNGPFNLMACRFV